MSNTFSG